jgi:hypothetical protein
MKAQDEVSDEDLTQQSGYIKHHVFEPTGSRIVVYVAADQGLDIGARYAVVCELHGAIAGVSSKRQAVADMRHPIDFCHDCCEAVADQLVDEGLLEVVEHDESHCKVCGPSSGSDDEPSFHAVSAAEVTDTDRYFLSLLQASRCDKESEPS